MPALVKIATFNANSIRSRLDTVLAWLQSSRADALCLQETKAQDRDFPRDRFEEAGFHVAFRGEKSYNGVALVSRLPIEDVRYGFDDGGPADEARLLAARVGELPVVNTYVPQGREIEDPMFAYKLQWFGRLRSFFERHYRPDLPLLWAGDMNVAPEPADVHDPAEVEDHVCFHRDARRAFASVRDWGFTDLFRMFHPEPDQYTFFDYRVPNAVKRKMGWRLDHLLATKPLAERCTECRIDIEPRLGPKPSDHTFLWAQFDL